MLDLQSTKYNVEVTVNPGTQRVIEEQWFNTVGQLDRPGDLPARLGYHHHTGNLSELRWYKNGILHRDGDKPASVSWNDDGSVIVEEMYLNDNRPHRDGDKPAEIVRYDNGAIAHQFYFQHGKAHREQGAAVEYFTPEGQEITEKREFWRHGRQVGGKPFPPPEFEP